MINFNESTIRVNVRQLNITQRTKTSTPLTHTLIIPLGHKPYLITKCHLKINLSDISVAMSFACLKRRNNCECVFPVDVRVLYVLLNHLRAKKVHFYCRSTNWYKLIRASRFTWNGSDQKAVCFETCSSFLSKNRITILVYGINMFY